MAMSAAFMHILSLEKEVARLRHHVSVLSKLLDRRERKGKGVEKGKLVVQDESEEKVAAVGMPLIASGIYKVVAEEQIVADGSGAGEIRDGAEEIVAKVETMRVGFEEDEHRVVGDKIIIRLPDDRKRG